MSPLAWLAAREVAAYFALPVSVLVRVKPLAGVLYARHCVRPSILVLAFRLPLTQRRISRRCSVNVLSNRVVLVSRANVYFRIWYALVALRRSLFAILVSFRFAGLVTTLGALLAENCAINDSNARIFFARSFVPG